MIRVLSKIDYQKLIWKLINFSDVNWGWGGCIVIICIFKWVFRDGE